MKKIYRLFRKYLKREFDEWNGSKKNRYELNKEKRNEILKIDK